MSPPLEQSASAKRHTDHHPHGAADSSSPSHPGVSQANATHFDAHLHGDTPSARSLAARAARAMRAAHAFDARTTSVLDFACGTGALSRELAAYAAVVVGVDVSARAVQAYNQRVADQGIDAEEMRAVAVDELDGAAGELGGVPFDVVVCSMGYHHLADPAWTTRVLAGFLRPGGRLLVVDIAHRVEAVIPEEFEALVPHRHGFSEEETRGIYEAAGLENFAYKKAFSGRTPVRRGVEAQSSNNERAVDFFLAVGNKALA